MEIDKINEEKGFEAETRFREWLEKNNIPYIYLQQDTQTISSAFKKYFSGKRPDFLILIPNLGFIFVDVKYKKLNPNYKTYPIDSEETKKYSGKIIKTEIFNEADVLRHDSDKIAQVVAQIVWES